MYMHIHVHTYTYIYIYTHIHIHTYIYTYICFVASPLVEVVLIRILMLTLHSVTKRLLIVCVEKQIGIISRLEVN